MPNPTQTHRRATQQDGQAQGTKKERRELSDAEFMREEGVMIEAKVNQNVLYVKGCLPHYRRPIEEIAKLRRIIYDDLTEKGVELPLKDVTHLRIAARRHSDGGDISNIIHAVCQAIDGNTLEKSLAILVDDGQLDSITARWYSADHSFKRGHSSMVEPLPSKQKTRGSIPPVRSSFFICGEKITKHDSVADSVSRRADLNCEPSGEKLDLNGSKPQASPDLDGLAYEADQTCECDPDSPYRCFRCRAATALQTLREERDKWKFGFADQVRAGLDAVGEIRAERDSLRKALEEIANREVRAGSLWAEATQTPGGILY